MPVVEARDLRAEADGKGFNRDATPARDQKMAEFVKKDDNRQNEQEAKDRVENHRAGDLELGCRWGIESTDYDYLVVLKGLCKPGKQASRACPRLSVDREHVLHTAAAPSQEVDA